MTRIYLASRFSRREEMLGHAEVLASLGHEVVSRWVFGAHEIVGKGGEDTAYPEEQRADFAAHDIADVERADIVLSFTEEPRKPSTNRGGRHVEFGYALALGKRRGIAVGIVGPRENVFHCLPEVKQFNSFDDFLSVLTEVKS